MVQVESNVPKCPNCLSKAGDAASLKLIELGTVLSNAPSEHAVCLLKFDVWLTLLLRPHSAIESLLSEWNGVKIVHGKPRHSQSQGSIERKNQDVRDSLVAWMKDNNTSNLTQNFDETDTENVDEANMCGINNQQVSSPIETEDSVRVCIVCEQKFEEEIFCFECDEYFHSTCTSAPQSEIPLCHLCAKKSAIETSRKHCERGLQEQAEKMLQTSGKKFPPASTSDNILVSIPDVDRGRLTPRNVLAVIMEEVEPNLFSIGTKHGKLEKLYSRNEFQLTPNKSLEINNGGVVVRPLASHQGEPRFDFRWGHHDIAKLKPSLTLQLPTGILRVLPLSLVLIFRPCFAIDFELLLEIQYVRKIFS
ncbi:hypothetical protein PR048_011679 [Dryococelus australis]|uniref:Uncharacterized protein n=1 Tax=Dryococelus australis TaxID=614101 RepID=A0ABQ9HM79_9NEOP|nr:hypothetical protein PR048_011679 [Dryococelus australis]